jgi:hypothetical protein
LEFQVILHCFRNFPGVLVVFYTKSQTVSE